MIQRIGCQLGLVTLLLLGALILTSNACADERDRFETLAYTDSAGGKLLYRLLLPKDYDAAKKYPLVLFLHGAGERGNDNEKQLVHGMRDFASDKIREMYPCFVVAPQCPSDAKWVDAPWSGSAHEMPKKAAEPLRLSIELVGAMQKEFSIDPQRLYVTGLSMGGFGTWDAIQRHPKMFAAAAPICGGGDSRPAMVKPIAQLPIWAFHGDKDTAVKTQRSRDMVAALKQAGGAPLYTEYAGVGHNSWSRTYSDPKFYEWMFQQRRK